MLLKMAWSVLFWHQDHQQNHLLDQNHDHPNKPQLNYPTTNPSWNNTRNFLLPLYDTATAPSELNSASQVVTKLNDFAYLYGSKWDELMELWLKEYQQKQSPGELISENQPTRLQEQLHLEFSSDFDDADCNDIVAPVAADGGN